LPVSARRDMLKTMAHRPPAALPRARRGRRGIEARARSRAFSRRCTQMNAD